MKHLWRKFLIALLIAALLSIPCALMEEDFDEIEAVEPVDVALEEQTVDISEDIILGEDEACAYSGEAYAAAPSEAMFEADGVAVNEANFPDEVFRDHVRSSIDEDQNGILSASEIAAVDWLSYHAGFDGVKDLTGIKYFTNLKKLNIETDCNPITALDLSGLTNLTDVRCHGEANAAGSLVTLNVSGCTALTELWCSFNQLASLNVEGCTSLDELICNNNQLTSLNVKDCTSLDRLFCSDNKLPSLALAGCAKLDILACYNNPITTLDISALTKLSQLYCDGCALSELNIGNNPELVACYNRGVHTTENGVEMYELDSSSALYFNTGVAIAGAAGQSTGTGSGTGTGSSTGTDAGTGTGTDTGSGTGTGTGTVTGPVASVTVISATKTKTKATVYVGTTYQLDLGSATGKSFKSSNKKVVTVSKTGLVTPKKAGKAKITFKAGKKTRTVNLTVKDPTVPTKVTLNLKGTIAAKVGVPQTLTATLNAGAVSKLKWTSSNKKVATVKNGVVTFKKKGTVTITVTTVKGNKKAKVKFKVTK